MAESSNARDFSVQIEELEYLHASNVNVSDFVSVKFSRHNFQIWQKQMLCLTKSQMMHGMLSEDPSSWGRDKSDKMIKKYQELLKGWILGSLNEEVLHPDLYDLSPYVIWKKLEDLYGSQNRHEIITFNYGDKDSALQNNRDIDDKLKKKLYDVALKESWWRAKLILKSHKDAATEVISQKGFTMLDLAILQGNNYFVGKLLNFIEDGKQLEKVNKCGHTSLHTAANCGNTDAAKLLVRKRKELLYIADTVSSRLPLTLAFEERHVNTFLYLSELTETLEEYGPLSLYTLPRNHYRIAIAVDLLTKAIHTKQFDLATKLVNVFPVNVTSNYEVLMALIRNFPSDVGFGEALIYPSFKNVYGNIVKRSSSLFYSLEYAYTKVESILLSMKRSKKYYSSWLLPEIIVIFFVPIALLYPIYQLILLLIIVLLFPLSMFYSLLWKAFAFVVRPIKNIEKKKEQYKEAEKITKMIYRHPDHGYDLKMPILEAARMDADTVLNWFLWWSANPMIYFTEKGHDIMQLAVINRSSKVYKLIRSMINATEYYTLLDTSGNNLLHLAGKLPPLVILNCKTGAALQLQRELQWFEELTRYTEHRLLTQRNNNDETPEMVFSREHADLVKEGENWMKTTAESCSITAALIVTIVFAAAITVPGGSNQETGIPLFKKEIAFTTFAASDAISLFAAVTSLSVFLSILTTRFAEKDFLVVLPRRLLIGLLLLLLSTAAMMVAFSTILFLVFCDQRPWMLAPIGAFACIPIAAIVSLQFPLMFDLFQSTYFPTFGKEQRGRSSSFKEE